MKTFSLSIICFAVLISNTSCTHEVTSKQQKEAANKAIENADKSKDYGEPKEIATLEDKSIDESSGIVASRINNGIFWTHNDSGNPPLIYAFDTQGKHRGAFRVIGAENDDWEDIAIATDVTGKSYLYIGDIGDNGEKRESIIVYRVAEPVVKLEDVTATKANPLQTEKAEAIRLLYPDGKHNAETLLVHPTTGDIYVITKTSKGAAGVYKTTNPSTSLPNKLVKVANVSVPSGLPGLLTGGEISPDGRRVILCDYFAAFEFVLSPSTKFDDLWKTKPLVVNISQRQQGEAVCYSVDGKAIYATSEKTPAPLIEVKRVN